MAGRHKNSRRGPKGTGVPDPAKDRPGHEARRGVVQKQQKRSLSANLSRRDPTDDEISASLAELRSAHDRAAAIIGAAVVEVTLVDAIKVCLDDDSDTTALFYEDKSPFGTFSSRIIAAKAFGLVSARLAKDLDNVRDIRNQFAHAALCLDFENELIAGACRKLKRFPDWENAKGATSEGRKYYLNACYALTVHLLDAAGKRIEK